MANNTDTNASRSGPNWTSLRDAAFLKRSRRGFTRQSLIIGLAVFALISLLSSIQAGDINVAALLPAKTARGKQAKPKLPVFLQSKEAAAADGTADADPAAAEDGLTEPGSLAPKTDQLDADASPDSTRLLAYRAFGKMEPLLAARRLEQMNDNDATLILASQNRRSLARILEMADPQSVSTWVDLLLQMNGRGALLPPGESLLDKLNSGEDILQDPAAAAAGTDPLSGAATQADPSLADPASGADPAAAGTTDPATTVSLLPDFRLSPQEREAFLTEFPQYRADADMQGTAGAIPVISVVDYGE